MVNIKGDSRFTAEGPKEAESLERQPSDLAGGAEIAEKFRTRLSEEAKLLNDSKKPAGIAGALFSVGSAPVARDIVNAVGLALEALPSQLSLAIENATRIGDPKAWNEPNVVKALRALQKPKKPGSEPSLN